MLKQKACSSCDCRTNSVLQIRHKASHFTLYCLQSKARLKELYIIKKP